MILPKRINRWERAAIVSAGFIGGTAGLTRGWLIWGFSGALFASTIGTTYAVTLVVLLIQATSAFRRADGLPKFSLKAATAFITAWAVLLTLFQLIPTRSAGGLFEWHIGPPANGLRSLASVSLNLIAISWCLTLPMILLYNASSLIRYGPSPVCAYCFLSSFLYLLTLIVLVLAFKKIWPLQYAQLGVVLIILSAIGFVIESKARTFDYDHSPQALLAIVLSTQTYFALVWLIAALSGMAAG